MVEFLFRTFSAGILHMDLILEHESMMIGVGIQDEKRLGAQNWRSGIGYLGIWAGM
jgi:primosomal replication protein N